MTSILATMTTILHLTPRSWTMILAFSRQLGQVMGDDPR